MVDDQTVETRMAILIESIRSLSTITANHDVLLTKLIDDHEQRIRLLEICALASALLETLNYEVKEQEKRLRQLENWRWYAIGIAVGISAIGMLLVGKYLI